MKNTKLLLIAGLTLVVVAFTLTTSGCKKEEPTAPATQGITEDLFPLIVGRKLVFSGFLRDRITNLNIEATGAVFEARMTMTAISAPTPFGTAHLLSDSMRVPTGVATPPTIWVVQNFFIQRTPPTGTGNFSFLTNIGRFYRLFGIARADSLRWITLVRQDLGVGVEWTGFDSSWTAATGLVRLQIVGKVEGREPLTLAGQSFNPYRVTAIRKVYLGGSSTPSIQAPTATLWLEPNIGIVKFIFDADGESPGFFREYKSRNF